MHEVSLAVAAIFPGLASLKTERLDIALFDERRVLIGVSRYCGSSPSSIQVPLRTLVRDALDRDAMSIVIAHNHPSGNPQPSSADRDFTHRLWSILKPLSIRIDDHFIFARGRAFSFRAAGLL